jgi:iron complex transport system substrate-binding protein
MRLRILLAATILLVFLGSYVSRTAIHQAEASRERRLAEAAPQRIISLAPSVTETLFALGLGDRVVGVTRYCDYPPEALQKPCVGGYFHPNFEAVVALNPDLIVSTGESVRPTFEKLGLPTLVVHHTSIDGILESIAAVSRACGEEHKAQALLADIERRLEQVRGKTEGLPRPRVLCVVQRTLGTGRIEDAYIAGRDGHLDRIIALAGGRNAYRQGTVRFPVVAGEGLLTMDPDVIIDLSPGVTKSQIDRQTMAADWQQLSELEAVKRGQVYLVADDYATVPGPRFILLVEKLARMIHPDLDWQP